MKWDVWWVMCDVPDLNLCKILTQWVEGDQQFPIWVISKLLSYIPKFIPGAVVCTLYLARPYLRRSEPFFPLCQWFSAIGSPLLPFSQLHFGKHLYFFLFFFFFILFQPKGFISLFFAFSFCTAIQCRFFQCGCPVIDEALAGQSGEPVRQR